MDLNHRGTLQMWNNSIHLKHTSLISINQRKGVTLYVVVKHSKKGNFPSARTITGEQYCITANAQWDYVTLKQWNTLNKAYKAWKGVDNKRSLVTASFIYGYCLSKGMDLHLMGILEL